MQTAATKSPFGVNNFDMIRLFASAQVAHFHIFYIMGINVPDWHLEIIRFLGLFPGVPIFFFISGFLISKSWEKSPSLKHYAINRFLRIYPALFVAVTLSFILIHVSGYVAQANPEMSELIKLFFAKISIVQFYNPDFMRNYGDGVMNGSLWTITVELQFYCFIPILYLMLGKVSLISSNWRIAIIFIFFLLVNVMFNYLRSGYSEQIVYKLFRISFAPWIYMFLVGVFFQRNFAFFYQHLHGKFLYCLVLYIAVALVSRELGADFGNSVNPIMFFLLAALIFSTAYSCVNLSKKLLHGADISYGLYIYHMPVVNFLIFTNYFTGYWAALAAASATLLMSLLSWFIIERNALKLKPRSIKKII